MWTSIVITCPHEHWCSPIHRELSGLPTDVLLVVPDPEDGAGAGVGSGGATLNALLVAAEHLSARRGYTTIVSDILHDSRILVLHLGPSILPLPVGLLTVGDNILARTNLERIVEFASVLFKGTVNGVMVAGTDILLQGDLEKVEPLRLTSDICLLTVPASLEYATAHGVCVSSAHGVCVSSGDSLVDNILYQPDLATLRGAAGPGKEEGSVNILSGLVWFSPSVTETLLNLHCVSPLDGCTYMGQDSGEQALQISLYYDILTASCQGVSYADFIEGKCGKTLARGRSVSPAMTAARRQVWTEMRRFKMIEIVLRGLKHKYLPACKSLEMSEIFEIWGASSPFHLQHQCILDCSGGSIRLNSSGETNRKYRLVYGAVGGSGQTPLEERMTSLCSTPVLLVYSVHRAAVNVIFSLSDQLFLHYKHPHATFLGLPWTEAVRQLNLSWEEVWHDEPEARRSLFTAKLFLVKDEMRSLQYISFNHDLETAFHLRKQIHKFILCSSLEQLGRFPQPYKYIDVFKLAVAEGWSLDLLESLDRWAITVVQSNTGSELTGKLAYVLAMTSDLLGTMADGRGGLRSGPANNKDFSQGFRAIEEGAYLEGLVGLKQARGGWLDRPVRLVRVARHYEGVVQLLVRKTVMSAQDQIQVDFSRRGKQPAIGEEVVVECPVRLDLSGGWTDTPPICYELGGKVVDVALLLDACKPVGCRLKRIQELKVQIVLNDDEILELKDLSDLSNHSNPMAKGALLKCCLLSAKLLDTESGESVEDQLAKVLGSGLRLQSWSNLPQGSGMGTSSILAGAVVAGCWTAAGFSFTTRDVVHAVLVVEQLLTTGGGWQDQVGGLYPGLNLGSSPAHHQVSVHVEPLRPSTQFLSRLEDRLLVLYTGKPRLAKNLLQNVVRNWFSTEPVIYQCFQDNLELADTCAQSILAEDLALLGSCLSTYFTLKKILAPGSEPHLVRRIFKALEPFSLGGTLAGAGGGGFLAALLKDGVKREDAVAAIQTLPGCEGIRFFIPTIDLEGMRISIHH